MLTRQSFGTAKFMSMFSNDRAARLRPPATSAFGRRSFRNKLPEATSVTRRCLYDVLREIVRDPFPFGHHGSGDPRAFPSDGLPGGMLASVRLQLVELHSHAKMVWEGRRGSGDHGRASIPGSDTQSESLGLLEKRAQPLSMSQIGVTMYHITVMAAASGSATSPRPTRWMTAGTRCRRTAGPPETSDRASAKGTAKRSERVSIEILLLPTNEKGLNP